MTEIKVNVENDGRLRLRYSTVKNYPVCPHMFKLSQEYSQEPTRAQELSMAKGNLFEYYVLGSSSDPRNIEEVIKKNKGRFDGMQKKTVDRIKLMAERVKKHFINIEYSQLHLVYDKDPRYIFESHIDALALIQFNELNKGKPFVAIVDTKWTASIEEVWNNKSTKDDFLQAIVYVWMIWLNTQRILPFVYVVAQSIGEDTVIKPFVINVTLEDMEWFVSNYIERLCSDKSFSPIANHYNCLGHKSKKGKCRYIQHCEHGKKLLTKPQLMEFKDLEQ